ncbi:MAG: 2-(1,2-epoxy-1,2-dihydrophenyl)acetyl-CoA isomerase [Deltaproteobacteria bacterium]|nr:2-(1,2-epoxy-1,2-dihydrophenyl)acetyl-CoA isomerase [Deltaproteobacteria bacterium]
MAYETILYEKQNGVGTITLNRPQSLNAFIPQMNKEVLDVLRDGERDKEVRCMMITGAGRAFCAGQDLKGRTPDQKGSLGASLREKYNPMIKQIRAMEKIVIAAVNGVAAGAGCNFALACDLRVASEDAKFIQSFVRVGLAPDSGGSFILTRLVGLSKAMELLLLGDTVDAKEAQRIGLVARVFPTVEFAASARQIAEQVAKAPRGIGLIKRAVNHANLPNVDSDLEYEAHLQEIAGRSADYDEGVKAFLEKRTPVFTGK